MNKSDIRRIIKEEITSILNENTPKYSPGDTFMYMGTKHTVISDDGFVVKAKLPTGNITTLNHNQIKPLNESPSVLIANKERIADEVLKSNLSDKDRIANFIIRSSPSEVYLQKIIDMLGMNITDLEPATSTVPKKWNPNRTGNVNPADYGSLDEVSNSFLDTEEGGYMREYIDDVVEDSMGGPEDLDLDYRSDFDIAFNLALTKLKNDHPELNFNAIKANKASFWQ